MLYILGYYLAMKLILIIYNLLLTMYVHSKEYFDYIIDNNAKRTIVMEHNFNETSFFRAFKLEGSFTDNLGNYGNWEGFVTTFIQEDKVIKLDVNSKFTYQNNKNVYFQGYRKEGTDESAGVGRSIIIYSDKFFKNLVDSKCLYSAKFFEQTLFSKIKCKIKQAGLKELEKLEE